MPDYLPRLYQRFRDDYPDLSRAFDSFAAATDEAGPLSSREQRLSNLGIAVGCASEGGVRSHVRKALDEGIEPDAIRHVVVLAISTAGYPTAMAAYKWANEVLDQEA